MGGINNVTLRGKASQYDSGVDDDLALLGEIGNVDSAALWVGTGTSTTPTDFGTTADKNIVGMWTSANPASGDTRAVYWRHYFNGIGSGEVLRAFAQVNAASVATGGTVNGAHFSCEVTAACSISGAGNAIRATLGAATETRTLGGTAAALQLDSNIAANNTVPTTWSFVRVTNSGAVTLNYLLNMPTVASAGILAAHITDAVTHSIRCVDAAGTVFYLMATTTATNRTGGA